MNETVNDTNETYIPYEQRPETYFVPVLFLIIFVVGVLGNGTLVIIFLRHKNMRNIPNTYIFSLALADLLVILSSIPFTSIIYTLESWPWGELICKLSETAKEISVGVSVFTLTALSADRFFAIVNPMKKLYTNSASSKATWVTISITISIWILSIILAIPSAIASHTAVGVNENLKINFTYCYPFQSEWLNGNYPKVNVLSRFLIMYIIPLSVITIFYLNMAVYLVRSTKNMPWEAHGTQKQIKARKKVAGTVLGFVVIFAICFLPNHIFMLWFYFNPRSLYDYNGYWHYLRIIGFCLAYSNSCVNPLALYWISGTFRKYYNRYLLCKKTNRNSNTLQATTLTHLSSRKTATSVKLQNFSTKRQENFGHDTTVSLMGNGNDSNTSKL